jgi:Zn-finger nucleic acid-binding protein
MPLCPRCNDWLQQTKTPQGIILCCPKCNGRAVGLPVLRRAIPAKVVKGLWLLASEARGRVAGAECPICHEDMTQVPVPVGDQQVALDVCTACQFVWFDTKDFEQLPAKTPEPDERDRLPEKAREALAMLQVKKLQEDLDSDGPADSPSNMLLEFAPDLLGWMLRG